MAWLKVHLSLWLLLVYTFTVSALPASRNFTVVKLLPPPSRSNDSKGSLVPQESNTGVMADQRSAFLGKEADSFRFHRPGFEHVPGSVSLESSTHPGLYLRYKNYKFHLEKMKPSGLFEKDATFIERKTQTNGASGYELFNHPGWFMCHDVTSKLGLVAKKLDIGSEEFLERCLYMAVAVTKTPTKKAMANQAPTARTNIQEITGDISSAVSTENLSKGLNVKNDNKNEVRKNDHEQNVEKVNTTLSKSPQLESVTNSTSDKNNSEAKRKYEFSFNKTAEGSSNQTAATQKLNGEKIVNNTQVTNASQNALKTNISILNETKIMASHPEQAFVHHNNNPQVGLSKNNPSESEPAKAETAALHIQNTLLGAFTAAKQQATSTNSTIANGIGEVAGKVSYETQNGGSTVLMQNHNSLNFLKAENRTANVDTYGSRQFHQQLIRPNIQNQEDKFLPMTNREPANAQQALPGRQFAQLNAKAAAFVNTALKNQRNQARTHAMGPQRTKGVGLLYGQQQRLNQPFNYYRQQMSPQRLRTPNIITAPAHSAQRRPLISTARFPTTVQQAQYKYRQPPLANSGFKHPPSSWGGMMTVGGQPLVGGNKAFQNYRPTRPFEEKTAAKLEDDMSDKTPDKQDKCISLKFINKIRKPIKLVSSMKLGGYLITAETFKLKTIFKHPRKHHHVILYARDADDIDNEVLLNNNNAIAVTPGGCDLPFRSVLLSHHGQISNVEIERLREEDEYTASMDAVKKASHDEGDENLSQWTAFGACAATCGRSIQTRTRMCKTGKICKEPTIQSRTCIQTPCPRATCIKTFTGKCCALPFVFRGAAINRCLVDPKTNRSWCAVTPNFDKEKRWGYCQASGSNFEKVAPVLRSFLPGSSHQLQPLPSQCSEACARICMSWCPQHCCIRTLQG